MAKKQTKWIMVALLMAAGAATVFGQDAQAQSELAQAVTPVTATETAAAPMPRLVRYSGSAEATPGQTLTLKFSLYANQTGGDAVWSESQQVTPGESGKYSVLLGAATENGLPQKMFSSAQAKWLGVTVGDGPEQPRTLLVATPYSLKSSDAETLGGHPATDFVLTGSKKAAQPASGTDITQINVGSGVTGGGTGPTVTLGLSSSYLETLGNEIYPQLGGTNTLTGKNTFTAGKLLLGTSPVLSVANVLASSPVTVTPSGNTVKIGLSDSALLTLGNSVYAQLGAANTFTKPITFASGQTFPGTISLSANNAFTGSDSFSKPVTFASGQTFPGTGAGTITGVTTTSPLTGSGTSGSVAIALNTSALETALGSVYAGLSAGNSFTGSNSFSKAITFASGQTFPGVATLSGNNTFTGTDTISGASTATSSGELTVTDTASGNAIFALSPNTAVLAYSTASSSGAGIDAQGGEYGVYAQGSGYAESIGVYAAGTAYGVYGLTETTGATGVVGNGYNGVMGIGPSNGGSEIVNTGTGVVGTGAVGAYGSTTYVGTAFSGVGVLGEVPSSFSANSFLPIGVWGVDNTGDGVGVAGSGYYGVYALGGTGVYAEATASTNDGTAVAAYGGSTITSNATGTGVSASGYYGVYASGVYAIDGYGGVLGVGGEAGNYGVNGITDNPASGSIGWGVSGGASSLSTEGDSFASTSSAGVWGDFPNGDGDGSGVLATGDSATGLIAVNNSSYATIKVYNYTSSSGKTVFETYAPNQNSNSKHCTIDTSANLACSGSVTEVLKTDDGESKAVYAVASAENWIEDAGTAQLSGGAARVSLEALFGQTVNAAVDYHVFLTPNGDCRGLYVASKSAKGFEVRELGGGHANISFDYRIMAKRKGFETARLEDLTERENARDSREAELAARRSAAKPMEPRPAVRSGKAAVARPNAKRPPMMTPRVLRLPKAPVARDAVVLPQK